MTNQSHLKNLSDMSLMPKVSRRFSGIVKNPFKTSSLRPLACATVTYSGFLCDKQCFQRFWNKFSHLSPGIFSLKGLLMSISWIMQSSQYHYWKAHKYSILTAIELGLPVSESSTGSRKFMPPLILNIKTGWWDASLMLWDFSQGNKAMHPALFKKYNLYLSLRYWNAHISEAVVWSCSVKEVLVSQVFPLAQDFPVNFVTF